MNWFKKKPQKPTPPKITCHHCFEIFDNHRILFKGKRPKALDPDFFHPQDMGYTDDVLTSLLEEDGHITTQRICPYCHKPLHPQAGFVASKTIILVGSKNTGKTTYLTSLIHYLKTVTPCHLPISISPIDNHTSQLFREKYEYQIIDKGELLPATKITEAIQPPLAFTLSTPMGPCRETNLIFLDLPGEGLFHNDYIHQYCPYLQAADGLIFLIDPLQIKTIGQKINFTNQLEADLTKTPEPLDVLTCLLQHNLPNIPLAITLSKSDLLLPLQESGEYISGPDYNPEDFFKQVDPNFYNGLKMRFDHTAFFALSALGKKPNGVRIASYAPMGVDQPLLWLLRQLDIAV